MVSNYVESLEGNYVLMTEAGRTLAKEKSLEGFVSALETLKKDRNIFFLAGKVEIGLGSLTSEESEKFMGLYNSSKILKG